MKQILIRGLLIGIFFIFVHGVAWADNISGAAIIDVDSEITPGTIQTTTGGAITTGASLDLDDAVPDEIIIPEIAPEPQPPQGPPQVIRKVATKRKVVCLTFDDAGSAAHVRKIMDVLEKYNVKATFFVLGSFAANNPEVMQEMLQRGHEVASHSYNHKNYSKMSVAAIIADMEKANTAFKNATGESFSPYLRPPYGAYNKNTLTAMQQLGYSRLVMWSVDTLDWKVKTSSAMMGYVKKQTGPGGIILMHLMDKKPTLSTLPTMITWLQGNGYEIMTLTEMMAIKQ